MTTIRDIARQAGVSVSTASLALNGSARVAEATRHRVEAVAERLGYRPSRAARNLSLGRTHSIVVLDPAGGEALTGGFFARFVRGLHDAALERGYTLAISIVADESEALAQTDTLVQERWCDGVVVLNPSDNLDLLALLGERGFPHVVLGRDPRHDAPSVDNDNRAVGRDAARHLLGLGRRRLVLLDGPEAQTFARDRADGFRAALREAGLEPGPDAVRYTDGGPDASEALVPELLAAGVDGVVAVSDLQAIAVLRGLRRAGARVPDDVAVVGMNNDALGDYVEPRLTTIDLDARALGRAAARMLLGRIAAPDEPGGRELVGHRLIQRESA